MYMIKATIFFTTVSMVVCGLTYLLLKKRLKFSGKTKKIYASALIVSALILIYGPIHYRFLHANVDDWSTVLIQFTQYYLMGWVGVTLIIFAAAEFFQYTFKTFDPSKRIFLTEGVAKGLLATASLSSVAGFIQLKSGPKVERVTITLPTLPKSFDGFTIAQLSDVHIGPLLKKNFIDGLVEQTLALNADMVALTGDLVDGSIEQLTAQMGSLKLLKPKHGVYFCTGNHEYYSGADEWIAYWESIGVHVLKNSNHVIQRQTSPDGSAVEKLMIAGVFDVQGERFSPDHRTDPLQAAKHAEEINCKILLAHNPRSIELAVAAGFHLQLSGHTHAGQFYPFAWLARLAHQYFEGLYQVNEHTQIYVNRGTGFWGPPNRLGKTGEITHITLKSGLA